ncbi:hypothetical protein FRC06_007967 [Ceratobasidium sp. 370]|nr:hypothetical protein FRC06_007967 [Ceratobasidium sp. 370]
MLAPDPNSTSVSAPLTPIPAPAQIESPRQGKQKEVDSNFAPDLAEEDDTARLHRELASGYKLQACEIEAVNWWADLDDEKVDELEELYGYEPEELRIYAPEIREYMSIAQSLTTDEGVLRPPDAPVSVDEIMQKIMTPSMQQRLDGYFKRVVAGERPKVQGDGVGSDDVTDAEVDDVDSE